MTLATAAAPPLAEVIILPIVLTSVVGELFFVLTSDFVRKIFEDFLSLA